MEVTPCYREYIGKVSLAIYQFFAIYSEENVAEENCVIASTLL